MPLPILPRIVNLFKRSSFTQTDTQHKTKNPRVDHRIYSQVLAEKDPIVELMSAPVEEIPGLVAQVFERESSTTAIGLLNEVLEKYCANAMVNHIKALLNEGIPITKSVLKVAKERTLPPNHNRTVLDLIAEHNLMINSSGWSEGRLIRYVSLNKGRPISDITYSAMGTEDLREETPAIEARVSVITGEGTGLRLMTIEEALKNLTASETEYHLD